MNETASKLPEYPIVMAMKGVGTSLGPQLMAEIGDVTRFTHKGAITAFAGVDPGVNESGTYEQKSVHTSKRGSSDLRKTLYPLGFLLCQFHESAHISSIPNLASQLSSFLAKDASE